MSLGSGPANAVCHMGVHTYVLMTSYLKGMEYAYRVFVQLFRKRLEKNYLVQIFFGPHFPIK